MTEAQIKSAMGDFVTVANATSITELLNLLTRYISIYHAHGDMEALRMMNDIMVILLIKEGLMDPNQALADANFVIRQRELFKTIKQIKS